ncbi:hypothetical protein HO133_006799 [Letharia lupina]|uniref:Uncharacterized protein n=1 Tax=Letharia lupina TaxID=560253 RepID=A0A8H6F6Y1_9LECA|nr:uncharacterized protein HO133_006799 [Letharia lupina]KAF6217461.1 hypothetical protein HO133_006799 [Letharia lupina]
MAISSVSAHPAHIYNDQPSRRYLPSSPPTLPTSQNGVLPNGTIINASTNWTKPSAIIPSTSTAFNYTGPCTIYVVQAGYGDPATYSAWARDASDAAIGDMGVRKIGATADFAVGGGKMSFGTIPPAYETEPAKVVMSWEAWGMPAIAMFFEPVLSEGSAGCAFAGDADGDEVTYFECTFGCSPQGDS